jgi:phage tail-like protein
MSIPIGLNTALTSALGTLGRRLDPYLGVNFVVEIEGLVVGGFRRNGYVHKVLKGTTYSPIVLSHGLTDIDTLWAWHERVRRGVIQRKNGTVMLLDTQRLPAMWWNFADALPVKWVGPSFDASAENQVAIERLELVHRGITKPIAGQLTSAVSGLASKRK